MGEATSIVDYVIIGAGSSGCVLADRLTADGRNRVMVLEAGGSDLNIWVRMPIGYGGAFHHPRLNWRYMTEPDPGIGSRQSYWPRGKVIGGSSSINAMVFVRGAPADYDDWAALGNDGWAYRDVLPHFIRMETFLGEASPWRGRSGPVTVTDASRFAHPLTHAFVAAATAAGFVPNADLNGASQEGIGFYQITTRNGLRCSAATGYLNPARRRRGLGLVTHAHVTRIAFDGCRATAVEYRHRGRMNRVEARKEIILAAGAVNSPQILQLSGIGDGDTLGRWGLDVIRHNPAVGENLQDHIGYDYVYETRCATLNNILGPWLGRGMAGVRYVLSRNGPLSLSINQAGGFIRSHPGRPRPNLQLYFSPLSYTRKTPGKRRLMSPDSFPGVQIGLSNCRPTSRGRVCLRSPDPLDPPAIRAGYLSEPDDLDELAEGALILRRIMASAPLAALTVREVIPGAAVTDPDDIREDIRQRLTSVFHPCGTCAMGPDPAGGAVVDKRLRVHGVAGLRVADASIAPLIPSGNINAMAIMIGEKAAELILEDDAAGSR